jgi:REP element-mobilizing transposase RayT
LDTLVMPEHVHLLISEPLIGDPSKIIQAYGEAGLVRINDWTWWEEKIQRSAG